MINDSGNRTKFESGAVRDIQEGKGRCDLLPLDIIDLWCDDGLQCTLYYVGEYLKHKGSKDSFLFALDHFAAEHQAKRIASGEDDKMITLDQYKWNLVLEVAKHFEEGAKKYGDRNWEKGIPCDRYIDSAVRHYCKWRAGWDDEPHDRAFIWNIVCCEWTRQRYGWNLERLETAKKYENILGMKTELLDHKCLMSGSLASVASSFNNKKRFTRSACLYLYDRYGQPAGRVWILNAYKSANLYAAIGNVWKRSNDVTPKILEAELAKYGWKPGVDFVVEALDDEESESKKFAKIGEQLAKGLQESMESVSKEFVNISEQLAKGLQESMDSVNQIIAKHISESPLTIHVKKEDIQNKDVLAQIKEQETANLKEACAIIEHEIACFNAPSEVCWGKTCKACEHYIDPDITHRAINQLLEHAKKSLENTEAE